MPSVVPPGLAMGVYVTVPEAAHLTRLSLAILSEAIATRALPATLDFRPGALGYYRIRLDDLADWCRRCGYTHLWASSTDFPAAC